MGFVETLELKGRVVNLYMTNGMKLDGARVKEASSGFLQVTHKNRTKYVNPDHVLLVELG